MVLSKIILSMLIVTALDDEIDESSFDNTIKLEFADTQIVEVVFDDGFSEVNLQRSARVRGALLNVCVDSESDLDQL